MVRVLKPSHLPSHFVAGIKILLERKAKEIEKQIQELKKQDPFFVEGRLTENEPTEDAMEQEGHSRVQALVRQLEKTLLEIKKALKRISIGKYGICAKCGRAIEQKRLEVLPMTTFCSECARRVGG